MIYHYGSLRQRLLPAVFALLALILCVYATGCSAGADADGTQQRAKATSLDAVMEWEREFTLEENERTINVIVHAAIDPFGGFLVADEGEGFARRYSPTGQLLAQFGGKGSGPGEFQNLIRVVRLQDGTLAAFDVHNKVAFFDSAGERLLRTSRTPVGPLHSVMILDDSLALLGGQLHGNPEDPDHRLHIWNLRSDSLIRSFFSPALPSDAHAMAAQLAGWVNADRRGDTLAVVTSLSDTIYLLSMDGAPLEKIPMRAANFRPLNPRKPTPNSRRGIVGAREWIGSFSLISHVHWVGNTFVVQYQDRDGPIPNWRLLGVERDGRPSFEIVDSPMLLATDDSSGILYLVAPGSLTPNMWRSARLADR
jgi:hypothetical protein